MNCPEHLILSKKYLQIWHIQSADIRREYIGWGEVLNPLRYEICMGRGPGRYWHWNDDAWLNRAWSGFWFRVRARCWLHGHSFIQNKYSSGSTCSKCFKRKADGEAS